MEKDNNLSEMEAAISRMMEGTMELVTESVTVQLREQEHPDRSLYPQSDD
ncbi:hypothetical protein COMA1_10828 [Candidatus Nitrospira nitrosa]|uniref:Uncharacterized protein n=1 Tax=Candidatus Nitrospira nitrosa TaxID=1742972 RepID=A0A0S4L5L5_9BACT|nr:hypothetical protein [Candidatus Nitrospira nitrosa]CUS32821.1 hypothetical protein COMA1_10828 [Candidatus Nitrospira nitrosa]